MTITKSTCLALLAVLLSPMAANADPILGDPTGLNNATETITFDELGNLQGLVITNEFAGATFEGFGWDNATFGQAGSTGFSGGDLVNGIGGFPSGYMQIFFDSVVIGATFAAVDQGGAYTISAILNGVLIESFSMNVPFNPGAGYIGFKNIMFDQIEIVSHTGLSAMSIDTLAFKPVPEPGTLALLGLGLAGMGMARRKKKV